MTKTVTHPHWRVTVETSGEQIVAIETEMLRKAAQDYADYQTSPDRTLAGGA